MLFVGVIILQAPQSLAVEEHVAESSLRLIDVGSVQDALAIGISQIDHLGLDSAVVEGDAGNEATPFRRQHLVERIHVEVDAFLGFPIRQECRLEEVGTCVGCRNPRYLRTDIRILVDGGGDDVGGELLYHSR